jgi:transglutaminase-like putative cysteine protease
MHLLLTPQTSAVQTVAEWQIEAPGLDDPHGFIDAFGNRAHLATLTAPDPALTILVSGIADTHDRNGIVGRLPRDPVPALFMRQTPLTKPVGSITSKLRNAQKATGEDRIALLHTLMGRVAEVMSSDTSSQSQTAGEQSQSQSLSDDDAPPAPERAAAYAQAFVGAARAIGIPARYVNGYLCSDDTSMPALHAWAEAWDESLGWIGFDPLLGLCPTERHVRLSCGLDAAMATTVRAVPMLDAPRTTSLAVSAAPLTGP